MSYRKILLFILLLSTVTYALAAVDQGTNTEANKVEVLSEEVYRPQDLPSFRLTSDVLIRALVGEIAAQHGNGTQAIQNWLEIADITKDPRAARQALEYAIFFGQANQALEAAQMWVNTAPTSRLAREAKIVFLLKNNQIDKVDADFDRWLKPEQVPSFLIEMSNLWDVKTDMEAVLRFNNRLLARFQTLPEAYFARAMTLARMNRDKQALADLDVALRLRPWWKEAVIYKARLLEIADPGALDAFLKAVVKAHPSSSDYALLLAKRQVKLGQLEEAKKSYESILAHSPEEPAALVGASFIAEQIGDYTTAETLLRRALKTAPDPDPIRILLGGLAALQHHFHEAIDWYKSITIEKYKADAIQALVPLYARLGEQEKALELVEGLPIQSDEEKYQKALIEAQAWRGLRDYAKAIRILNKAIEIWPDSKDLLMDRSFAEEASGDYVSAEKDLSKLLTLLPNDAEVLNALGYLLASRTDRLSEANAYLEQAHSRDPESPAIIDSLGWLRFRQGRLAEALSLLEKAYRRFPDPEIAAHYAEILWQSGKGTQAKEVLGRAIQQEPDNEVVITARKKLGI